MFYTIIVLTIFSTFLLIKNFKNRYTWVFFLMVTGLIISIFSLTLGIGRIGNYRYPVNDFFKLDYKIFLYCSYNIKLSIYSIYRMQNIGIGIFLFTVPLFTYEFVRRSENAFWGFKRTIKTIILAMLPIFYVWFYDPETKYSIFIMLYYNSQKTGILEFIINNTHMINYLWVLIYLFYPIFLLAKYYFETSILLIRKQIISLAGCMFFLNAFFYIIFFIGTPQVGLISKYTLYLIEVSTTRYIPFYYYNILPLVMMIVVEIMLFVLVKYGVVDTADFFRGLLINRNIKGLNENLRGVFHSFKNTIFTVKILVEQAETDYGKPNGLDAIKRIKVISSASMDNITRTLDSLKVLTMKPKKRRVVDAIENAINQIEPDEGVVINKYYQDYDIFSYYDFYHLTEVMINLLKNAMEATKTNMNKKKRISIDLSIEREWAVIKVTDNGVGISKKDLKRIFEPFYSTKSTHENWGVGLAYVYRVVKAHLGFISVDSVENEFTTFQILLPKVKGGASVE